MELPPCISEPTGFAALGFVNFSYPSSEIQWGIVASAHGQALQFFFYGYLIFLLFPALSNRTRAGVFELKNQVNIAAHKLF